MAATPIQNHGLAASARRGVAVTPDDDNDLTQTANCLFVGVGGNVEIVDAYGTTLVFKNLADGSYLLCAATRVKDANTTATDIIALYI